MATGDSGRNLPIIAWRLYRTGGTPINVHATVDTDPNNYIVGNMPAC